MPIGAYAKASGAPQEFRLTDIKEKNSLSRNITGLILQVKWASPNSFNQVAK